MIPINVNGFSLLYYYYIIDVILNNIFTNKLRRIRGFILLHRLLFLFYKLRINIAIKINSYQIQIFIILSFKIIYINYSTRQSFDKNSNVLHVLNIFYNHIYLIVEMARRKERVRIPTINMFYYTYISYDDYTILIHSFNCPAIKQGIFIFLSSSHHHYIILLLLNIVTHISLNYNAICYIRKNVGSPFPACFV